jgi:alanyl-tRNA synthetase
MTPEQIRAVEDLVNERILHNTPVQTEILDLDAARRRGAMMIFEEKYGIPCACSRWRSRWSSVAGRTRGRRATWAVQDPLRAGDRGGVRRIQASTGKGSLEHVRGVEERLERAARMAKTAPRSSATSWRRSWRASGALEKELEQVQRKLATGGGGLDALLAGRGRSAG